MFWHGSWVTELLNLLYGNRQILAFFFGRFVDVRGRVHERIKFLTFPRTINLRKRSRLKVHRNDIALLKIPEAGADLV